VHTPEEVVARLRQAEVLVAQEKSVEETVQGHCSKSWRDMT
jgi:hypothetical protein